MNFKTLVLSGAVLRFVKLSTEKTCKFVLERSFNSVPQLSPPIYNFCFLACKNDASYVLTYQWHRIR